MLEVVLFPDTTAVLITYLRAELGERDDTAIVAPRVPNPRPTRLVVVRRVGGVNRNVVTDEATVTVEAWDAIDEGAHDLAQLCRGLLHAAEGESLSGVPVYRVEEFAGPAFLPDPTSAYPRYTLTLAVAVRGEAE